MSWEWVIFALGMTLIICSTILGGIYLGYLRIDRKKRCEEYKQLKELLEKQQERESSRNEKVKSK